MEGEEKGGRGIEDKTVELHFLKFLDPQPDY